MFLLQTATNCPSQDLWILSYRLQKCRHRKIDENGFAGHGKSVLSAKCDQGIMGNFFILHDGHRVE
jgi:hypothetical protein